MRIDIQLSDAGLRQLEQAYARFAHSAVRAATDALKMNLSGQGRTGHHWPGLPFPSSAAATSAARYAGESVPAGAEYPTEQSGQFAAAVAAWDDPESPLVHRLGIRNHNIGKTLTLEEGSITVPARAPIRRTLRDESTQARMAREGASTV